MYPKKVKMFHHNVFIFNFIYKMKEGYKISGLLHFEPLFKAMGAESLHDVLSEPLIRNYLSLRQMSFPLTFTIMILTN